MTLKNIYARIPQHLVKKLSALAEMRQLSTSEIIRGIIAQFFEAVDKEIDAGSATQSTVQQFVDQVYQDTVKPSLPRVDAAIEVFVDDDVELDW